MKKLILILGIALIPVLGTAQQQVFTFADSTWPLPVGAVSGSPSANAVAPTGAQGVGTGFTTQGANFLPVFQVSSSAAATDTLSVTITCPSRLTAAKGCTVTGFALYYGILTTAATSQVAPACQLLAPPTAIASETASTVAGTNIPVTTQPVVGSANLGTVTAGQLFTTFISFNTPQALNGQYQQITCSFGFGQTGASAMVVYSSGGTVFGSNTPL